MKYVCKQKSSGEVVWSVNADNKEKAIKQAKSGEGYKKLKELYQMKQGEIPPADTAFDKGAD